MTNLCNAATCAKIALDKVVCDAIASAALNFYSQIVEFLRVTMCVDVTMFFQLIALLAVLCWVQNWLMEMIHFICRIPKVIKNIFHGKFSLCLLNCGRSDSKCTSDSRSNSCSNSSSNSCSSSSYY